ncbi:SOS response-associated peptidase family protein [Hydrogenophaga crassostreae]|nr:SOS response-associated peptidase family protein [Hydrogenophaga crassostreae]
MTELGPLTWPVETWPAETYPGYLAPILTAQQGAAGTRVSLARFGLVPRWCRDTAHAATVGRGTYNARCETVQEKPSFRSAWRERCFALVPMLNYFEPCWETGRAVRWRVEAADGKPLLAAALHECWIQPDTGQAVHSFSLLTANADSHALLNRLHRPGDEKRQLRLLGASEGFVWLRQPADQALSWLDRQPGVALIGQAAPLRSDPQGTLPF